MTLDEVLRRIDGTVDDDEWSAACELAGSGDRSVIPAVRAELDRFVAQGRGWGRDLMAHILAGLDGVEALRLLLGLYGPTMRLDSTDDGDVLESSLTGILRADPAGSRAVLRPLAADPDPDLRRAALWGLGWVAEPDDLDVLRAALADPDPSFRRTALNGLPAAEHDCFIAALADPDRWIRHDAVLRLAWCGRPAVVDHLIPLTADPVGYVRSPLGEAIGRLAAGSDRAPAAAEALLRLLDDPEPSVRSGAARGLGHLGPLGETTGPRGETTGPRGEAAGPAGRRRAALTERAADPDPMVRAAVAAALAVLG